MWWMNLQSVSSKDIFLTEIFHRDLTIIDTIQRLTTAPFFTSVAFLFIHCFKDSWHFTSIAIIVEYWTHERHCCLRSAGRGCWCLCCRTLLLLLLVLYNVVVVVVIIVIQNIRNSKSGVSDLIESPWWNAIINEILTCSVIVPALCFEDPKIQNNEKWMVRD